MPPRLNKRQQRELEELEALGGPAKTSDHEFSDDEAPIVKKATGMFAAGAFLASVSPEEDDDHTDGGGQTKKSKKGKKKKKPTSGPKAHDSNVTISMSEHAPAPQVIVKPDPNTETKETITASERKALKRAKQREKRTKEDDIDKVLAELAIRPPTPQTHTHTTSKDRSLADLIGVSLQHLDAEAELRKFFGSRVVQATKTGTSSPSRRNAGALRSNLTRPQPTWWAAKQREGLSIRPLTDDEVRDKLRRHGWEAADEKWWTVEYSKKYKSMTRAFMRTVMSGDPQGFWDLLHRLPWHADTLLQIAEVYRHREEHAQAVDFIDRALFTYERSFIGAFNLTSGLNRLDFDCVENRPFFLAIHRQVVDLQRRGCVRTGFEFARLLYSLDPWTDPHGALLHLDYVSIKANMAQWLVDVYDIFDDQRELSKDTRLNPSLLPGWTYSRALALLSLEKDGGHIVATAALADAIRDYPYIVPLLADKLDVSLPASVRGHPDCKIETDASSLSYSMGVLHLLSHLYSQRSSSLWKDHANWFADTVTSTFASLPSPSSAFPLTPRRKAFLALYDASESLRYSVYRHVIILESSYRRLFSFIPRYVLEGKSLACDPLPPKDAVTQYDATFFEGTEDMFAARPRTRREIALDQRRLAQMIPDAGFRQQLEGFFEAQGLENRFPGGIVQFAQVVAQLAPQELEDMMMNGLLAMGEDGGPAPGLGGAFDVAGLFGAGGMPGQMPGEDMLAGIPGEEGGDFVPGGDPGQQDEASEDEVDEEDEEDEEEEDVSPMPRIIRNILGRLWGRAAPAEESSSEDEDAEDLNAVD